MSTDSPRVLEEADGKPSTMRLISLLFALAAIALAGNEAALIWSGLSTGNYSLVLYFLGAAIGGKFAQKFIEAKGRA